jgi:molecular chaperone DnaK (HSP70)
MVKEAERFKEQDELLKTKVEARNSLENYVYQIKNTMSEYEEKFSDDDTTKLNGVIESTLQWIEAGDYTKEEYDSKQKEVEHVYFPIIQKVYGSHQDNGPSPSNYSGPNIEEVD